MIHSLIKKYLRGLSTDTIIRGQVDNGEFITAEELTPGDRADLSFAVTYYHRELGYDTETKKRDVHRAHLGMMVIDKITPIAQEIPVNTIPSVDVHTENMVIALPCDFPIRVVSHGGLTKNADNHGVNAVERFLRLRGRHA